MWDLSPMMRDQWEIDRNEISLVRKLGQGNFGEVWLGNWRDLPVAVKTLKPGSMSPQAFLEEAAIMKKFRHNRLVALYAVCSREEPILIIQEFMNKGSLLDYLRHEGKETLSLGDLIYVAAQVCETNEYKRAYNL